MAITVNTWTQPSTMEAVVGDDLPAATWNLMLGNQNAANNVLTFGPGDFVAIQGSPAGAALTSLLWPGLMFDGAADEIAGAAAIIPHGWLTATAHLWWTPQSGSGNVLWSAGYATAGDGEAPGAGATLITEAAVAAPAAGTFKKTSGSAVAVTAGEVLVVHVRRRADQAGDTLNGIDAALVAFELRRAT